MTLFERELTEDEVDPNYRTLRFVHRDEAMAALREAKIRIDSALRGSTGHMERNLLSSAYVSVTMAFHAIDLATRADPYGITQE